MREILFRGKRIDNGEWVYGMPWLFKDHACICPWKEGMCKYDTGYYPVHVIPETVGQYTGMTDKNGQRIFEGDVLAVARTMNGMGTYYSPAIKFPVNVVVRWDMCAWMWETICKDKRYISFPEAWCHLECEVIGNIHDNPELVEVREDEPDQMRLEGVNNA